MREADAIGKRYGKLPSDLLELSPSEWLFNLSSMNAGITAENAAQEKAMERAKRNRG